MELRRILAVALGLALIFLSIAPYIKARELTMQTPFGWEVLGSKRLRVPTKELQEIYSPDGTPTGRYGRPIDHDWFGEGKLIEIGGTRIWVLDTYQDARGCHVKVRVENLGGELTLAGGQSQGVQWGDLRLYITWAKFPPEEGDWRTAKGEYFYGFEEFELTLYRVPTAPAIPLSAAGAVLGVGLVLFGVAVIREGERRGILPILIGSAFLCALVIRFPGYEEAQPAIKYARLSWLGRCLSIAPDKYFSRFAIADIENVSLYDNYGRLLWKVRIPAPASERFDLNFAMSEDGTRILVVWFDSYPGFSLLDGAGNILFNRSIFCVTTIERPTMSANGKRIAYVENDNILILVSDDNRNILVKSYSTTYRYISDPVLNADGSRIAFTACSTGSDCWIIVIDNTGVEKFKKPGYGVPLLSRTGRYIYFENKDDRKGMLYDIVTGSYYKTPENNWTLGYTTCFAPNFTPDDSKFACATSDGTQTYVRIITTSTLSSLPPYTLPSISNRLLLSITPSGDRVYAIPYGGGAIYCVGTDTWETPLPVQSGYYFSPLCTNREFTSAPVYSFSSEVFVANHKYNLTVTAPSACFYVDGNGPYSSFTSTNDPGKSRVVEIFPPSEYVTIARGNFTDMDNVKQNRLEIYMDNDKSISIAFLGKPGTPSCSPTNPKPTQSVTVSWSKPDGPTPNYYELQIDNVKEFTHPTTYTQIVSTSYSLSPPGRGWELGIYYVRVRAAVVVNSSVVYSYWSDPAYFEVNVPLPPEYVAVSPRYPYPYQKVSLSWGAVSGITTYRVSWDGNTIDVTGTSCELSPPTEGWVAYKTYTVDVYSYYQGNLSETPAENDFTVTPFPAPSWVRVENKYPMPEDNVRVTWEGVEMAKYYDVALDENTNIIATHLTENIIVIAPPLGRWSAGAHRVLVRAVDPELGASAWVYDTFSVQPVIVPGPAPPPPTPAPGKLQLAAMVPMLPHPLVSAFNVLGQVAGVYTLSLLMVLGGLGLITVGLRRVP
jgi:hypothetical protein